MYLHATFTSNVLMRISHLPAIVIHGDDALCACVNIMSIISVIATLGLKCTGTWTMSLACLIHVGWYHCCCLGVGCIHHK